MRRSLELIAEILSAGGLGPTEIPWETLGYLEAVAVRSQLIDRGYAPKTVSKVLAAWRGVLKEAWRAGWMTADAMTRACDVASVKPTELRAGRALAVGEVAALLQACDADNRLVGVRDQAMVAVLYGCGVRRSELVGIDVEHVDLDTGDVKLLGKGSKERVVRANQWTRERLRRWVAELHDEVGPVFRPITRHQTIREGRLNSGSVRSVLRKRAVEAGVAAFTPHDLRRTTITSLLDAGAGLELVQRLAGHARPETTAMYDRRGSDAERAASELLPIPATPAPRR